MGPRPSGQQMTELLDAGSGPITGDPEVVSLGRCGRLGSVLRPHYSSLTQRLLIHPDV